MMQMVEMPLWLLLLILVLAVVAALDKVMIPSVRWYFRRRLERAVARLNTRLERPIQPFKLARRHDMIQRLIYDPEVTAAVQASSRETGVPENVVFQEATRYAREIVPSFSAFAYFGFAIRAARFLSNAVYRVRLGHVDEEALRQIDPEATVVFVMNHRSNMDYVLVTYLAADQSALSYAVGEWARVWPLSRLIRAMGAYFIRRKSRSDLYRSVLACYVRHATEAGVTQAIFPEGGLSLNGELGRPKLGLLKYIVDTHQQSERDVVFVPVALNYDRVLEDTVLTAASGKAERRFNARIGVIAGWMIKHGWLRMTGRAHRFGYAAVSFGAPISLKQFQAETTREATVELSRHLMRRIGALVPVLPVPLVAFLLLRHGSMSRTALLHEVDKFLERHPDAYVHMPRHDRAYGLEVGLRQLLERRIVVETNGHLEPSAERRNLLEFYANSINHLVQQPDEARVSPQNSATASEISAIAGS
ncbi:1-acyl-sn-glycerol-3-phosphate acyltransferase [Primorskyibacter sp. S87]|uniref:1-acyl-sn-glycerol-3-phosphate acyltransferase n=1 Tax=Primorskyibacter sp. S87 TaxID=3415126 RepID=UPI003C7B9537